MPGTHPEWVRPTLKPCAGCEKAIRRLSGLRVAGGIGGACRPSSASAADPACLAVVQDCVDMWSKWTRSLADCRLCSHSSYYTRGFSPAHYFGWRSGPLTDKD
jgi:hypothetical protein